MKRAKEIGLNGLILNYEPKKNYTREHAKIYGEFLNEFHSKAKRNGLSLGTVVSSWGILKVPHIACLCMQAFMSLVVALIVTTVV